MDNFFEAKTDEIFRRAERGAVASGDFLNPEEQFAAEQIARAYSGVCEYCFFGGCHGAERAILVAYPYGCKPDFEELAQLVSAVKIKGSGYSVFEHRSVLGSVLGMGIDRRAVGDIVIQSEKSAIVFVQPEIARFLTDGNQAIERIGRDKVRAEIIAVGEDFEIAHEYLEISGTVSSPRIDAVIAELVNISRERAKTEIKSGNIRLNYTEVFENDIDVSAGDIISVRGSGKYRIENIGGITRKGRMRINALKYK